MPKNILGREIPEFIEGSARPPSWEKTPENRKGTGGQSCADLNDRTSKVVPDIKAAIAASGLKSGMTVSFHHHLRNGDFVVNAVIDACAEMGIRDLTLFPTALFGVHKKLIEHIRSGVIRRIMGSVNGPIGQMVSEGGMDIPVVLRSHGGRPRAVVSGDVRIDVAFVAAPTADDTATSADRRASPHAVRWVMPSPTPCMPTASWP